VSTDGTWTYTPNPNANGTDSFQVRATDAGNLTALQTVHVTINPINDPPSITTSSFYVLEQSVNSGGPGALLSLPSGGVAQLVGADTEGAALAFQVLQQQYVDRNGNAVAENVFGIDSANRLTIHAGLDYEMSHKHQLLVRAWDGGAVGAGAYTDKWIDINVGDVAPTIGFSGSAPVGRGGTWSTVGTLNNSEPGGAVTYEVVSTFNYQHFEDYEPGWSENWWNWQAGGDVSIDSSGNVSVFYRSDYFQWEDMGYYYHTSTDYWEYAINIRARDAGGNVSQTIGIRTSINGGTTVGAAWAPPGYTPPVVLDMDGDGVELVSLDASTVKFRAEPQGELRRTGWVGADDALLALDRDGDGAITSAAEISFIADQPGAKSDLEGLAAFDTDADGYFDRDDARFNEFVLWRDKNQDGISQAEELSSLSEQGIDGIRLARTPTGATLFGAEDNVITATSDYLRNDGTTGDVGDVVLVFEQPIEGDSAAVPSFDHEAPSAQGDSDIGEVDRSAEDSTSAQGNSGSATAPITTEPRKQVPQMEASDAPSQSAAPQQHRDEDSSPSAPTWLPESPRLPDISTDWEEEIPRVDTQSALHASLDSIARRRLLMIDAMSTFSTESSVMLELKPQRHVDARTLELLTAVSGVRSVA
jgi:hypothetical protein